MHYELVNFKVLKIERNITSRYIECLIYHLEQLKSWSNSQPNFANIYGSTQLSPEGEVNSHGSSESREPIKTREKCSSLTW